MFHETITTEGIKISVIVYYQSYYSKPHQNHFVFSYKVCIENVSNQTVQLLRRHWYIFDSNGTKREVEGEGVIGQQPIIAPNEKHEYTSWCPLKTPVGRMYGTYLMKKKSDNTTIQVKIPTFNLITPTKLN